MPPDKLYIFLKGIVVTRILYALPIWGTDLHVHGKINAFLKRAYQV